MKIWNLSRLTMILAFGAALSGCYNLKYYSTSVPGPGATHKVWVHGFLGGIITVGELNLDTECPNGVYKMKSNISFVGLLLTAVTGSIYTPSNVVITCGSAP